MALFFSFVNPVLPISTHFNPFQFILTKNFNSFQLQPTFTHFYQPLSILFKNYSNSFTLQTTSTFFNQATSTNFYPSTQRNINFYHLQSSSTNFNLFSPFINPYLPMKRTCLYRFNSLFYYYFK